MATAVSDLSVLLTSDVSGLNAGLSRGAGSLRSFTSGVDRVGGSIGSMESAAGRAGNGIASFTASAAVGLAKMAGAAVLAGGAMASLALAKGFNLAAQFETAGVQLTALTGSATRASSVLAGLRAFAERSPFEFPELLDASKRLLAVGVNAGQVVPFLRELGDVAAGVGAPVGEVADQFVRVAAEGQISGRQLREFGRQGIPVMQALAARFRTSADGVRAMAESGRIGLADLKGAFDTLTGPTGRFGGIVEAQSRTMGGAFHTLLGTVEDTAADVAEALSRAFRIPAGLAGLNGAVARFGPAIVGGIVAAVQRFTGQVLAGAKVVLPVVLAAAKGIAAGIGAVAGFVAQHGAAIKTVLVGVGGTLATLALPAAISAIGAAGVGVIGTVGTLAAILATPIGIAAALGGGLLALADHFGYVDRAMKLAAASITWTGAQWKAAIHDLSSYTATVLSNLAGNITGFFGHIPELLSGQMKFGDLWKPLADGFASTLAGVTATAAASSKKVADALGGATADLKVQPFLDPSAMTLGITPEIKRPSALLRGSAESQAARYARPAVTVAGAGPAPLTPAGSAASAAARLPAATVASPAVPPSPAAARARLTPLPTDRTTPPARHGTPIAGLARGSSADPVGDYLRANPSAVVDRSKPPAHATVAYGAAGRAELSDATARGDGTYAVRSASTGLSAVVDQSALDRIRRNTLRGHANDPASLNSLRGAYAATAGIDELARSAARATNGLRVNTGFGELNVGGAVNRVSDTAYGAFMSSAARLHAQQFPALPTANVSGVAAAQQQSPPDPKRDEDARQANDLARRIEYNTRPLQTNAVQTVSF